MRGGGFHNLMVDRCDLVLRRNGFTTALEHPIRLPDGLIDFIDVYATHGDRHLAIEVETTPRTVRVNAAKAVALGLPLWIVVPNRRVRTAVQTRLGGSFQQADSPVHLLLLLELEARLTSAAELISAVNRAPETKHQIHKEPS